MGPLASCFGAESDCSGAGSVPSDFLTGRVFGFDAGGPVPAFFLTGKVFGFGCSVAASSSDST